jgi:glycerol-3-phosphate acyltransferase PlsY
MELIKNVLLVFFGYISGSFPPAYITVKLFKNKDIREIGSGNVGAMNVLKNVDVILGIITGILDVAKGFIPVYLANRYSIIQWIPLLVAVAAVAGHNWSIFLNLTGGKGAATTFGGLLALGLNSNFNLLVLTPSIIGLILALIFFRDFYIGALLAYSVSPFSFLYFRKSWVEAILILILAIIVIYKLRFDLKRSFEKRRKVIP